MILIIIIVTICTSSSIVQHISLHVWVLEMTLIHRANRRVFG